MFPPTLSVLAHKSFHWQLHKQARGKLLPNFKTINESLTQSAPLLHAAKSQVSHGAMRCSQRRARSKLPCPTEAPASSGHCVDAGASTCGQGSPERPPPKSKASGQGRRVALSCIGQVEESPWLPPTACHQASLCLRAPPKLHTFPKAAPWQGGR